MPPATDTRGLGEQPSFDRIFDPAGPPIWSCSGRGLPGRPVTRSPVGSYPTFSPLPLAASPEINVERRLFSVALSFGSPRLGVTQRPALWSPDFPPTLFTSPAVTRPPRPGMSLPTQADVPTAPRGFDGFRPKHAYWTGDSTVLDQRRRINRGAGCSPASFLC